MRSLVVVALAASAAGACVENEDIASYASAGTQYCVASAFVFRGVQVDRALEAEAKFTVPLLDGVKVLRLNIWREIIRREHGLHLLG